MNRAVIVVAAVIVFGIGAANYILGQRLIFPYEVVEQRGFSVPWYITWVMVWVSVACAVTLALFLLGSLRGRSPKH